MAWRRKTRYDDSAQNSWPAEALFDAYPPIRKNNLNLRNNAASARHDRQNSQPAWGQVGNGYAYDNWNDDTESGDHDVSQRKKYRRMSFVPNPIKSKEVFWQDEAVFSPISRRNRSLAAVLAADATKVYFDVRYPLEYGINRKTFDRFQHEYATFIRPTPFLRLISEDFPWSFDIDFRYEEEGRCVTVGDVWGAIYSGLQMQLADAEWALLTTSQSVLDRDERRRMIREAVDARPHWEGRFPRRVDWLGKKCIFRGLEEDADLARQILPPGKEYCHDTYVVKFFCTFDKK